MLRYPETSNSEKQSPPLGLKRQGIERPVRTGIKKEMLSTNVEV